MLMERAANPEVDVYEAYEFPQVLHQEVGLIEEDGIVWWVIFVGFAYSVAMAYAAYCTSQGGSPDISLTWKGFKVSCIK
jgi:hypothetical protein